MGCPPLRVNVYGEAQAMLKVALFVQDEVLAHKLQRTLDVMGAKVVRYDALSNSSTLWRSRHSDLIVVHSTPTMMDWVRTFIPDPCGVQRAATLALVSEYHMAFATDLLDAGFDRCLPVSFNEAIFCAVVRVLMRRRQGMTASVCHYGALSFNHATHQACIAGVALDLTPREAQVLGILLKRVGQIISKERFLQDIAPDNMTLNTTAAEVYIHRLRKKISHDLLPIRNIKRCGYFLPRHVDPSENTQCQAAMYQPVVDSVRPRYELVRDHLAV
jgi:DNA-binding response OmpR family regulator